MPPQSVVLADSGQMPKASLVPEALANPYRLVLPILNHHINLVQL